MQKSKLEKVKIYLEYDMTWHKQKQHIKLRTEEG